MFLEANDERHLYTILGQLGNTNIKHAAFYEPDINDELTSIALMPSQESKDFCKRFKLAKYAPKARLEEREPLKFQVSGQYRVGAPEIKGHIPKEVFDELGF